MKSTISNIKKEATEITCIFNDNLQKAIDFVKNDMNSKGNDSIDLEINENNKKRQKICVSGHVNQNVTSNRKYCTICKNVFRPVAESVPNSGDKMDNKEAHTSKAHDKSVLHPNIENKYLEETPIAMAVGALPVNPNTYERISYVLEEIQKSANIHKNPAYKLVFGNNTIVKTEMTQNQKRKFVVITFD